MEGENLQHNINSEWWDYHKGVFFSAELLTQLGINIHTNVWFLYIKKIIRKRKYTYSPYYNY